MSTNKMIDVFKVFIDAIEVIHLFKLHVRLLLLKSADKSTFENSIISFS